MSPNKATKKVIMKRTYRCTNQKAKLGKKRGTVIFKCYMRSILVIFVVYKCHLKGTPCIHSLFILVHGAT